MIICGGCLLRIMGNKKTPLSFSVLYYIIVKDKINSQSRISE